MRPAFVQNISFRSCKDKSCLPRKVCPSVPLPKLSLCAAEFNLLQAPACTLTVCSHTPLWRGQTPGLLLRWTFFPGSVLSKDRFSVPVVCCRYCFESVLHTNYMCCVSTVIFGRIPLGSSGSWTFQQVQCLCSLDLFGPCLVATVKHGESARLKSANRAESRLSTSVLSTGSRSEIL